MTPRTAKQIVLTVLDNPTSIPHLTSLISPKCTYISLCYTNPTLSKLMPYCGIHSHSGPTAIASTFTTVSRIWTNEAFEILSCFSDEAATLEDHSKGSTEVGERGGGSPSSTGHDLGSEKKIVNVAMFGSFKYRSTVLHKGYESPFSIWCQVDMSIGEEDEKGRVVFMQFMEDTFGTGATFEKEGVRKYEVVEGEDVEIGVVGREVGEGEQDSMKDQRNG